MFRKDGMTVMDVVNDAGIIQQYDLIFCDGKPAEVRMILWHPAATHPESPIRNDWPALRFITGRGSRWVGFNPAYLITRQDMDA